MVFTSLHKYVTNTKCKHLEFLREKSSDSLTQLLLKWKLYFVIKSRVSFIMFLKSLLENVSDLENCQWILGGVLWALFCFHNEINRVYCTSYLEYKAGVHQERVLCQQWFSELEYRTILFDNIKTHLHLHVVCCVNKSIESVSIFVISLVTAPSRMSKADCWVFYIVKTL